MAPKHNDEILSFVAKCKKTMMCLTENISMLDTLHSSMSYTAVAVSSVLVNRQYITSRKRKRTFTDLYMRLHQKV